MKRKIFVMSIVLVVLAVIVAGCTPNETPNTDYQNQTSDDTAINTPSPVETNDTDSTPYIADTSDWRGAADNLLSPMLSIFGIDWVSNENPDALVTFDFIEPDGALRVYYDRDGNIINEYEAPFLYGDSVYGWAYAESYSLYDFDNDGIPEIAVRFVFPESCGGLIIVYVYADGEYSPVWESQSPFVEFFAEPSGNIAILERRNEDLRISRIIFNGGFTFELLADWGEFWSWDYTDLLNEPLTPIEPMP